MRRDVYSPAHRTETRRRPLEITHPRIEAKQLEELIRARSTRVRFTRTCCAGLAAVGLPASRPATDDTPAVRVVLDLRHTFATLQMSSGLHFM